MVSQRTVEFSISKYYRLIFGIVICLVLGSCSQARSIDSTHAGKSGVDSAESGLTRQFFPPGGALYGYPSVEHRLADIEERRLQYQLESQRLREKAVSANNALRSTLFQHLGEMVAQGYTPSEAYFKILGDPVFSNLLASDQSFHTNLREIVLGLQPSPEQRVP